MRLNQHRRLSILLRHAAIGLVGFGNLGRALLPLRPDGARLVLVSRAAVVDYDALMKQTGAGRMLAAGLPPVRMQQAAPELVGRYRDRPVG